MNNIQIVGDSRLIMDWFTNNCHLQVLNLERWKINICKLQETFHEIMIQCVYRDFNTQVDSLSKEALCMDPRVLLVTCFEERMLVYEKHFMSF